LSKLEVTVIGAGIIGLAAAYHLVEAGAQVTVIDRDPEGDKTSLGNAGGIAVTEVVPASAPGVARRVVGWLFDPLGPLSIRPAHALNLIPWLIRFAKVGTPKEVERISHALAAINSRVYNDLLPMLHNIGLSAQLQRKGALTVYETDVGYSRDAREWACKRSRGVEVEEVTGSEARQMEPALGPKVRRAVFTRQWSHVSDPASLLRGLRSWLVSRNVIIKKGEVVNVAANSASSISLELRDEGHISADRAVVASGAWSGTLAKRLGDQVLLESERGYNTTLQNPGITVERQLIFGEHKFVATPLSCGLRIGGAAEFGGLDAPANYKRSAVLVQLASQYLPGLRTNGGTSWAGHRPATPDSLPVIGACSRQPNVFYAFGHGHLGRTQAATTGKLISDLVFRKTPPIDMTPYGICRFT